MFSMYQLLICRFRQCSCTSLVNYFALLGIRKYKNNPEQRTARMKKLLACYNLMQSMGESRESESKEECWNIPQGYRNADQTRRPCGESLHHPITTQSWS